MVGRDQKKKTPPMSENPHQPLASEQIKTDRKKFFLDLKENDRGRVLKITEDVGGRRDTIMVPMEAARDLADCISRLCEFEEQLPRHKKA